MERCASLVACGASASVSVCAHKKKGRRLKQRSARARARALVGLQHAHVHGLGQKRGAVGLVLLLLPRTRAHARTHSNQTQHIPARAWKKRGRKGGRAEEKTAPDTNHNTQTQSERDRAFHSTEGGYTHTKVARSRRAAQLRQRAPACGRGSLWGGWRRIQSRGGGEAKRGGSD